jgi:plasmid stabilization system protein ParE
MGNDIFFEVLTPLGFKVRVTRRYWELIVTMKHPVMQTRETAVQNVLQAPDEVRRSRSDPAVFLFYRLEQPERWLCAVVRRLNDDGFLITTYPTDAIKEGQQIWNR